MKSVKFVIIFVLLLQHEIGSRELNHKQRYQIGLECLAETGIERSVVDAAIAGNIPANDNKYKEFLACSYKKQGYQSEKGEILIENIKKFLQKFYSRTDLSALDACTGYNEPTHGQNAFNALKCIMGHLRNIEAGTSQ